MSQRGHGHHSTSRRSSISLTGPQLASLQLAPRHDSGDGRYELAGMTSADPDRSSQQYHHHQHHQQRQPHSQSQPPTPTPQKALGVHSILNPSEPRFMASEAGGRPHSRSRESDNTAAFFGSSLTPHAGASRSFYPGHASTHSLPATPVTAGVNPFGRPPLSEHNSPVAGYHPLPAAHNTRKVLSPRPPRATSIGHATPARSLDPRYPPSLVPSATPTKRPYESDTPDEPRPPPGLHNPPSMAAMHHAPLVTPPRSISQPLGRPLDGHHHITPPSLSTPGDVHGRPHMLPSPAHFQPGMSAAAAAAAPGQSLSAMRLESPTEPSPMWPEVLRRQGFSGVEPQQAFMTLPGSDTPIPVQVDYSQASKKADEKRQRNAKASTRHRRKKKTLQEENLKQLQELKEERSQMLQQIEELMHQRTFYRDERNRLRDLVLRTPAITKHAAGPPSPVSTKSVGSIGDRSPLTQQHIPTPSQGYSSEGSSVDHPPPQLHRADERPEFSVPAYGPPSGGLQQGLSLVHGQASEPSRRTSPTVSSAGIERLPPLRAMDGHSPLPAPGLSAGQRQEQDLRTGQWRQAQATHYETGWATAPRKPNDTHQWQ